MKNFIIASEKKWNKNLKDKLQQKFPQYNWIHIDKKEDLTPQKLTELNPDKIFIPHWSYIIPGAVYNSFECIVFHMTDLPYGRGGSPLQNLIARGHKSTKVSALKVSKGIDEGPIYLKKPLALHGTAEEIFFRLNDIIFEMIEEIITNNLKPQEQQGEVVLFKRRTPDMSNLKTAQTPEDIYDMIRMLDAEGYPHAFIETENFKIEFTNAHLKNGKIIAQAEIITKQK